MAENGRVSIPNHPTFELDGLIRSCLSEDLGDRGDITSLATVGDSVTASGVFVAKEGGVVAGIEVAERVFAMVDDAGVSRSWSVKDGGRVERGDVIGTIEGKARSVLKAERLALNFMQRMSGVATLTSTMRDKLVGSGAKILDTRKTVPGLRVLDKWAVLLGGGTSHRIGLYDMMMIKDNHIAAAGGIEEALRAADSYLSEQGLSVPVEVEVETLDQVDQVLTYLRANPKTFLTRVMLDNMVVRRAEGGDEYDTSLLEKSVAKIEGKLETEASGNINLDSVEAVGRTGVQFISSGSLTHSVRALDISLKLKTNAA